MECCGEGGVQGYTPGGVWSVVERERVMFRVIVECGEGHSDSSSSSSLVECGEGDVQGYSDSPLALCPKGEGASIVCKRGV